MFRRPGARAMRFTATERFAVERVAFSWKARFPIAPLVSVKVLDGHAHGSGMLRVRALGFPVQTRSGRDIDAGEACRYLAELPWVPHAMAANHELEWREVDERSVEVIAEVSGERPTVRLEFDDTGDIVRCSADARPRDVDGGSWPTRWGGDLRDYRTLGAIRMPTRAEVYWDLPERRFVYWRGQVTRADDGSVVRSDLTATAGKPQRGVAFPRLEGGEPTMVAAPVGIDDGGVPRGATTKRRVIKEQTMQTAQELAGPAGSKSQ
jgi:hypothetical protein